MNKLSEFLKKIGPGILYAGAAIGVSHIFQSTRAGAEFGFSFMIVVILSNLLKYPFFEYGHRYTAATGESIISGYAKMGKWAVVLFFVLNNFTAVISTAGVTIVTAAILSYIFEIFFGFSFGLTNMSIAVLAVTVVLIVIGKYNALDQIVKWMIILLSIFTTFAFILSLTHGYNVPENFTPPEIFNESTFIFLIALMGWMPAPIESSTWSSLWAVEKEKQSGKISLKDTLLDFNVGYIVTAILACFFLALGALVMYGSGEVFAESSVIFTKQLINLYTASFGEWSKPIISIIAFFTMASTTLTVVDAYPRSLNDAYSNIVNKRFKNLTLIYLILTSIVAIIIISYYSKNIKLLVDIATTISFLSAPVFAFLNYKLVISKHIEKEFRPNIYLRVLSIFGLIFLITFAIAYLVIIL